MGTVLIVDEDANARIIAETLLRLRELEVHSAADGIEAYELLLREDVAVVVLELNLPGMNGFEVLRRLRSHSGPRLPSIPRVIVVTDRKEPEVERFVRHLGADAFLRKPVEPRQFIRTVEQLMATAAGTVLNAPSLRGKGEHRVRMFCSLSVSERG